MLMDNHAIYAPQFHSVQLQTQIVLTVLSVTQTTGGMRLTVKPVQQLTRVVLLVLMEEFVQLVQED